MQAYCSTTPVTLLVQRGYPLLTWLTEECQCAGLEELSIEQSIAFNCPIEQDQHAQSNLSKSTEASQPQSSAMGSKMLSWPGTATTFEPGLCSHQAQWLLPFTDMFSKRRQFAVDSLGRVHLIVGECKCFSPMHSSGHILSGYVLISTQMAELPTCCP